MTCGFSIFLLKTFAFSERNRKFVPHSTKNADIFAQSLHELLPRKGLYEQNQMYIEAVP